MQCGPTDDVIACGCREFAVAFRHRIPFRRVWRVRGFGRFHEQREPLIAARLASRLDRVDRGPHLHRTVLGDRDVSRESQCLVQVLGFEYVVAARDLGAFGERSVGDDGCVRTTGDVHRGRGRCQGVAGADRRTCLGVEAFVGPHLGGAFLGRQVALVADKQSEVLHSSFPPVASEAWCSTLYRYDEQRTPDPTD